MSEGFKISQANLIALLVYALIGGVAFGAIQLGQFSNTKSIDKHDSRIIKLEYGAQQAALERQENGLKYDSILKEVKESKDSVRRIEQYIMSIDHTKEIH